MVNRAKSLGLLALHAHASKDPPCIACTCKQQQATRQCRQRPVSKPEPWPHCQSKTLGELAVPSHHSIDSQSPLQARAMCSHACMPCFSMHVV